MTSNDPRDRMIVALDVPDSDRALALADRLGDTVRWYKVGLELYTAAGPSVVGALRERGARVFLDLKLHDIPNTVAKAVRSAAGLGVDLLTVHAAGGPAMLEAAAEARDAADGPRLLAVTVLTSLDGSEYPEVYREGPVAVRARHFAEAAAAARLDGIVCSAWELEALRPRLPEGFLCVTPGIRLAGGASHDQARVATPELAIARGASYLVVGRAITAADNPALAAVEVAEHIAGALRPTP